MTEDDLPQGAFFWKADQWADWLSENLADLEHGDLVFVINYAQESAATLKVASLPLQLPPHMEFPQEYPES